MLELINNSVAERLEALDTLMIKLRQAAPLAAPQMRLIAVSKGQPLKALEAAVKAGQRDFGENRWQEGEAHWRELRDRAEVEGLRLHFIGPLQSNKAREVVGFFDEIHSLDRPKLAQALAREMERQGRAVPCYVQINTGEEPQKAGILPQNAPAFIRLCREKLQLPVVGLMCVPPAGLNPAPHFAFLRKLAQDQGLGRLSMGMSGDWREAVRMGATDIRLGTAVFGERPVEASAV